MSITKGAALILGAWAAWLDRVEKWHRRHCHCGTRVPPGRGALRSAPPRLPTAGHQGGDDTP